MKTPLTSTAQEKSREEYSEEYSANLLMDSRMDIVAQADEVSKAGVNEHPGAIDDRLRVQHGRGWEGRVRHCPRQSRYMLK